MTPRQERLIARLWANWLGDKPYNNQTIAAFFFDVTRRREELQDLNAFEVFDCITNMPAQAQIQTQTQVRPRSGQRRRASAAGNRPPDPCARRAGVNLPDKIFFPAAVNRPRLRALLVVYPT